MMTQQNLAILSWSCDRNESVEFQ